MALGAVKPLMSEGKPVTLDDIDDLDEDATLGVGSIEDFSWKGILDFATCTECGRCQSQCPAWNTEKPLSPKMLIMDLRDHAFAKAPYLLADEGARASLPQAVLDEADRPLVGATEGLAWEPTGGAVIDPDVLWSCVTCGACVQQCPVDIEHVDHIVDMRRYQVLVESNFPAELNQLFKGMENKGNPWNMSPTARMDWAKGLDFDVKVVGEDVESLDEVDWLFWVGCAGAYEDRAKKTTRAVAELLDMAGVSFGVLGNGETCTGDPARRAGNEFVFQGLAQQNVETFKEYKVKKVVSTCAHCFNTLKNEYKDFGIELEVVHHTQLLNRLVREGKLTPVRDGAGAHKRSITYHDPCYIGRHNGVYSPPRELLQVLPGAEFVEMERNSERSFCCGAGGARMWMEENIGERINVNRTNEAVGTGADQIAVGCPFCRVMLSDGLTAAHDKGEAREEVEVLDVAQMLLASVKGEMATRRAPPGPGRRGGGTALEERPVETKAEPEAGDETQTEDTVTETAEVGAGRQGARRLVAVRHPGRRRRDEPDTASAEESPEEEAKAAQPARPAVRSSTSVATRPRRAARPKTRRPRPSRPPRTRHPRGRAEGRPRLGWLAVRPGRRSRARTSRPKTRRPSPSKPPRTRHPRRPSPRPTSARVARCSTSQAPAAARDRPRPRSRRPRPSRPAPAEPEQPTSGRAARCSTSRPRRWWPRRRRSRSPSRSPDRTRAEAAEPEPKDEQPATENAEGLSAGAALSQAATLRRPMPDPETEPEPEAEPSAEPKPEPDRRSPTTEPEDDEAIRRRGEAEAGELRRGAHSRSPTSTSTSPARSSTSDPVPRQVRAPSGRGARRSRSPAGPPGPRTTSRRARGTGEPGSLFGP